MRAWQRLDEDARPTAKAADPSAMMSRMFHAFAVHSKYWRAFGLRRRGVCQFSLQGAKYPEWYVTLDEKGGRISTGVHPHPTTRWSSAAASFTALMRGEAGAELVDSGAIVIDGDLELIDQLFRGLTVKI